jgi:hypothetical protein
VKNVTSALFAKDHIPKPSVAVNPFGLSMNVIRAVALAMMGYALLAHPTINVQPHMDWVSLGVHTEKLADGRGEPQ